MTTAYEIPLIAGPQQLVISLAGTSYQLTLHWCVPAAAWVLDIASSDGSTPIVSGIPLVTGADLLEQYAYLGIGGKLVAQTDGDVYAVPTFNNLGNGGRLYFVTTP